MELLAPAGDMERLAMALHYGADAVYLAGRQFGMRAHAGNFTMPELRQAVEMSHRQGTKVYVACNAVPHNGEIAQLPDFLEQVEAAGADALIITDPGVMELAKRYAPGLDIHISTQAGIVNFMSARMFHDMGAKRVILARELTLEEIREIRDKTPADLEIEAFGHGSMCVSFSGRCLLSNYLAGRDANRGACAQPCRWKYHLVEEQRPGEYLEISEDGGTHILNSRDMCMIEHIPEMIQAGITSLKIEGRMKSAYYAAAVTNAYRHVIDSALRGETADPVWLDEVNKVSHRAYSTGFFFDSEGPGQYYSDASYFYDAEVCAVVESCTEQGDAVLTQRNKFSVGDVLELMTRDRKPARFTVSEIFDGEGTPIESTPHPMMELRMRLPFPCEKYSILRRLCKNERK